MSNPQPVSITTGQAKGRRSAAGLPGPALAVLLLGFALSVTDFFIVNVALPTIGRDLRASDAVLELVVAAYGITYAVLLVLGGRLGDTVGRRRLFIGGMGAFTLMSLACALAPSIGVLLVARALQGASAALVVPQVLATIQARAEGEARAKAVGLYGATAGLSMVAGQLLGGIITWLNVFGTEWRGIFMVNVPVGLVGLIIARRYMPDTRSDLASRIDVSGTAILALALLCLLVPLTEGRALGWPMWSWLMLLAAPVGALVFVRYELALEHGLRQPLVPFSLMEHPSMRRGLGLAIPFFASFGGFMFLYAVVTQGYLGLSALTAGGTLAPLAAAFCAASLITARAVSRYGKAVISVGAVLQAIGFTGLLVVLGVTWPHPTIEDAIPALLLAGFGQGLVVSPLFRVILSDVPAQRAGAGAGVLATAQQTSLALGVALIGSLFTVLIAAIGIKGSALAVIGIVIVTACAVALTSRRLPNPNVEPAARATSAREASSRSHAAADDSPDELGEDLIFEAV